MRTISQRVIGVFLGVAGVCAYSLVAAASDDEVAHGSMCAPDEYTLDGGTWLPSFNGLEVTPGSSTAGVVCPIVRDNLTSGITTVWVRLDPSTDDVGCDLMSLSSDGYLGGYDDTGVGYTSGSSPQSITLSGSGLSNYTNGSYVVLCGSDAGFSVLSVRWQEP